MSKSTGLGAVISVDDSGGTPRTISNDVNNFSFATPRGVQDVTGVDKLAIERLLLLADFSVTLNGVFNPAATTTAHAVFSTVPSTSALRTTNLQPTSSSSPHLQCETLYTDYQVSRSAAGELTYSAPGVLGDGTVPTWA
jgi:hypothetical protein